MEMVILVDEHDNPVGAMEKMEAHRSGALHRAFSVLVFNSKGEMLLQKRAARKYHSAGLWTNACCSHPLPGEKMEEATRRRLNEEMGIDIAPRFSHTFIYKTPVGNQLFEHELDHVYTGIFDGSPVVNKAEVADWKFVAMDWLKKDVRNNPAAYTSWFRIIMDHPSVKR